MDDLVNLFVHEHGIYQQNFQITVIILFIVILIIFTKIFSTNSVIIIIVVIFALYISNLYIKVNNSEINDVNKDILNKLEALQNKTNKFIEFKLKLISQTKQTLSSEDVQKLFEKNKLDSLYIDSNLIVFLYSIINLSDNNLNEFYLLLKGTNNILKIKNDIEKYYNANNDYPENITEMVEIGIQLKTNCMNNVQNFIYTIPKMQIMNTYIDNIVESYNILISRNIKELYNYHRDYIRKHGINTRTKFINLNTKNYDILSNHPVIPSKFNNGVNQKLIDLYV